MPNFKQTRMSNLATMNGGGAVYLFSQGQQLRYGGDKKAMYKRVNKRDGVTPMGGICYAISAFWIIFHATQGSGNPFTKDRTVWQYLFDQGGINLGAAANLVVEHRSASGHQAQYFDTQLGKFGIVRRKNIVTGGNLGASGGVSGDMDSRGFAIGYSMIQQGEGYRILGLDNPAGGGHAVAGWVGQDVSFMDPNFGEFWLPNHQAFLNWFPAFWQIANYTGYTDIGIKIYSQKV